MKKCKHITCWTDYPFTELGDESGKPAPIRHVNIISYDGNKYCKVSFENNGSVLEVKAGYLYSRPERMTAEYTPRQVNIRKIMRMGDGKRWREYVRFWNEWRRRERQSLEREREEIQAELREIDEIDATGVYADRVQELEYRWNEIDRRLAS